jgi:hypothetical protein
VKLSIEEWLPHGHLSGLRVSFNSGRARSTARAGFCSLRPRQGRAERSVCYTSTVPKRTLYGTVMRSRARKHSGKRGKRRRAPIAVNGTVSRPAGAQRHGGYQLTTGKDVETPNGDCPRPLLLPTGSTFEEGQGERGSIEDAHAGILFHPAFPFRGHVGLERGDVLCD